MTVLSENIHHAWKEGDVYSVVFMDVVGAFNNVHHNRLLYNMSKRRIPAAIVNLLCSFLTNRTTQLCFNGITSTTINTPTGIPQGSPLSPILYMLYNADLLELTRTPNLALGFIDDIAYGVSGTMTEENVEALGRILERSETWRQRHGAQFEPTKYMLVHFTRKQERSYNEKAAIHHGNITINPTTEAKY